MEAGGPGWKRVWPRVTLPFYIPNRNTSTVVSRLSRHQSEGATAQRMNVLLLRNLQLRRSSSLQSFNDYRWVLIMHSRPWTAI